MAMYIEKHRDCVPQAFCACTRMHVRRRCHPMSVVSDELGHLEFELRGNKTNRQSCKIISVQTDWYDKELNVFYLDCYCTDAFFLETGANSSLIIQEFWMRSFWSGLKFLPRFPTCFLLCRHHWMQKATNIKNAEQTLVSTVSPNFISQNVLLTLCWDRKLILNMHQGRFLFSFDNTGCATFTC